MVKRCNLILIIHWHVITPSIFSLMCSGRPVFAAIFLELSPESVCSVLPAYDSEARALAISNFGSATPSPITLPIESKTTTAAEGVSPNDITFEFDDDPGLNPAGDVANTEERKESFTYDAEFNPQAQQQKLEGDLHTSDLVS
jgi:hypothetical protein